MTPREKREMAEALILSQYACPSDKSQGRLVNEEPCTVRTCFQRDTDRIIHSKSFRRLMHKTQVFLSPEGDHYRTRMTHTLEVARIARTIARALSLNEDLTEAAALGHDLGHTPFGHAGEDALCQIHKGGFAHNEQSLRVVDLLEKNGKGLNLCYEVRRGILCHTGGELSGTIEGDIVRQADRIAYINHDIDDALRAGILTEADIPSDITRILGSSHKQRIDCLTRDIIFQSMDKSRLSMTPDIKAAMDKLREFMFSHVYRNSAAKSEESKAKDIVKMLYEHYYKYPEGLPEDFKVLIEAQGRGRIVCDYIAGMTDKYAIYKFNELFVPSAWQLK